MLAHAIPLRASGSRKLLPLGPYLFRSAAAHFLFPSAPRRTCCPGGRSGYKRSVVITTSTPSSGGEMPYTLFFYTYLALWAAFLLSMHQAGAVWPHAVSGLDVLLLCLATFRVTEVV